MTGGGSGVLTSRADGIGAAVRRTEDARLIQGQGRFTGDLRPEGCLFLEFARSSVARGQIVRLGIAAARAVRGVRAVLRADDLGLAGILAVNPLTPGIVVPACDLMAGRNVSYVGQPVAAVVATSTAAARDAVEQLEIAIGSDAQAEPSGSPNVSRSISLGDVEAAFAGAAHVVSVEIGHARLAPAALEPRCALAEWDRATRRLTLHLPTQTPHRAREELARILRLKLEQVRVIAPDVGGAFGGKASPYPEDVIVARAAMRLGRPVLWSGSRSEDFLTATQGRGARAFGALALDARGRCLGLKARFDCPLGAWMPFSGAVPVLNATRILPGPYDIPALHVEGRAQADARAPVNIYRGAGRPEAAMLLERLMDEAARVTGRDPLALRRLNVARDLTRTRRFRAGDGPCSGDFRALMDKAGETAGVRGLRTSLARRRRRGAICGLGIALYVEPCGQGFESARLTLMPDGRIRAATGSTAQGQGRETAVRQILASALDVEAGQIDVVHGDTDLTPRGIGALASRSTPIGGSALLVAAAELRARIAAGETNADVGVQYDAPGEAWASGCCIAAVTIDRDTGVPTVDRLWLVDDAGRVINPLLVEGQLTGGMAQGLGEALMERIVYDTDGQLITGSFMDYALPRARDIPPFETASAPTLSPRNLLGAKGVGEAGCIGVPAAIANAIRDALAPLGALPVDLPLTSEKIWSAMQTGMGAGMKDGTR